MRRPCLAAPEPQRSAKMESRDKYYFTNKDNIYWRIVQRDDFLESPASQTKFYHYKRGGLTNAIPEGVYNFSHVKTMKFCHYCGSEMLVQYKEGDWDRSNYWREMWKCLCKQCGWWIIRDWDEIVGGTAELTRDTIYEGIVKRFSLTSSSAPLGITAYQGEKKRKTI